MYMKNVLNRPGFIRNFFALEPWFLRKNVFLELPYARMYVKAYWFFSVKQYCMKLYESKKEFVELQHHRDVFVKTKLRSNYSATRKTRR